KGLLLSVFFIAIGMSIDLKEVIGIGGEFFYYLPALFLLKVAVVIALGLGFRLGLRASVLAGVFFGPFYGMVHVLFFLGPKSRLLSGPAYTVGAARSLFSFVFFP